LPAACKGHLLDLLTTSSIERSYCIEVIPYKIVLPLVGFCHYCWRCVIKAVVKTKHMPEFVKHNAAPEDRRTAALFEGK